MLDKYLYQSRSPAQLQPVDTESDWGFLVARFGQLANLSKRQESDRLTSGDYFTMSQIFESRIGCLGPLS